MEYLRRFSSICNKRNRTLHFMSRKPISAPKHCYLNICISFCPSTSQSLPSGQTIAKENNSHGLKKKTTLIVFLPGFPTPSSYSECIWITQLCMEICLCKICSQMALPLQEYCQGRKLQQGPEDAPPGTVVLLDERKGILGTTCQSCKAEKCNDRGMETAHSQYVCRGKYEHPRAEENPCVPQPGVLPSDPSSHGTYFF